LTANMEEDAAEASLRLRDKHMVAYMQAYEDYLTCQMELQAVLKEAFFLLAKSRSDISRSRNTGTPCISALQFPREIEASARLAWRTNESHDAPELYVVRKEAKEAMKATVGTSLDDAHMRMDSNQLQQEQQEQLRELGVDSELREKIIRSLESSKESMGLMCGDTLVIDGGNDGSGMQRFSVCSDIKMAPSSVEAVNEARFQSLMHDASIKTNASSTQRPNSSNDPVRWFSIMPPAALRKSQGCFRRALELAVHTTNLRQRMVAAQAKYEAVAR